MVPIAPSMSVKVAVLPPIADGRMYQCGAGVPGVGPYFQYWVPGGSADG